MVYSQPGRSIHVGMWGLTELFLACGSIVGSTPIGGHFNPPVTGPVDRYSMAGDGVRLSSVSFPADQE